MVCDIYLLYRMIVSIPTPFAGCDLAIAVGWAFCRSFQSPHPRGVRCSAILRMIKSLQMFNPTHLTGCDKTESSIRKAFIPFQSPHPSRGAIAKHHNIVKYNLCILLKLQAFCTDTEHFYCPILNIFKYVIIYTLFFMVRTSGNIMYAYGSHLTQWTLSASPPQTGTFVLVWL